LAGGASRRAVGAGSVDEVLSIYASWSWDSWRNQNVAFNCGITLGSGLAGGTTGLAGSAGIGDLVDVVLGVTDTLAGGSLKDSSRNTGSADS
jgi:hypothetical protein